VDCHLSGWRNIINISHSIELEDGTYKYQGIITGRELDFLVEYAINQLLMQGALPFLSEGSDTAEGLIMPESDTQQ
jgi:hypothetical protein